MTAPTPRGEQSPDSLPERLRNSATGTVEWRVQHPVEKSYCMSVSRNDSIDPERHAREWLEDHRKRFPDSQFAHYEVAEVRRFTQLERLALEAADEIERLSALPPAPREMSEERILHIWDTHVGSVSPTWPLSDKDKLAFARAILAASAPKGQGNG